MHTFWKKEKKKNKLSSHPPSMEVRHPKLMERIEEEPIVSLHEKSNKPNSGK